MVDSSNFYNIMRQGYQATLQFISKEISYMRPEFVESVNKGFLGYYLMYGSGVMDPNTINEFLHYTHQYIVNQEKFYSDVPVVEAIKGEDEYSNATYLRGKDNELGRQIIQAIIDKKLDSAKIDIINLDDRILIMARDLGHAAVIDIDLSEKRPYIKYFIPKNCNKDKMSLLRGLATQTNDFATGDFETLSFESLPEELTQFMSMIPTDSDIVYTPYNFDEIDGFFPKAI